MVGVASLLVLVLVSFDAVSNNNSFVGMAVVEEDTSFFGI